MADIYTYRGDVFTAGTVDVSGFDVEATDGHIGKVDQATMDNGGSCLVVDTGFWIFGKKRMIPAGVVRSVAADDKKVFVSMTKDQIKGAPDYDHDKHLRDEGAYHAEQRDYYGQYGS